MSGFWTLKLGKSKQKEATPQENNGNKGSSDADSYKLVVTLMERVITDAEELISTIRQKAEKEASINVPSESPSPALAETTGSILPEPVTETETTVTEPVSETDESEPVADNISFIDPHLDRHNLYADDVELAITPPIEPAAVSKLYNSLQMTPEIKIMYSSGSWDKGTVISVSLEKPLPLLEIISEIPGLNVNIVESKSGNGIGKPAGTVLGSSKPKVPRLELQITSR